MYLVNLVAAVKIDAQADIDAKRRNNKHAYKANTNEIIGILKERLIAALLEDDNEKQNAILQNILSQVKKHTIPIRKNRTVPRNASPRQTRYHHQKKINC
jgi:hypothetical protein